ncbi:phytoene/squalene synthase family protein [candidate division KSB1 bacterium]|nr:phytoene/squalene synthase family protein [candidate division KSB1 bacterium]RQW06764.1 MAG: phytoene/squalene synthase family protein [candidate division KSB1 bacterium]
MEQSKRSMRAAFEYARSQAENYSKSFYLSSKILPKSKKWDTFALYSFCRYVDNIVDNPRGRTDEELLEEVLSVSQELRIAFRCGESEHPVIKPFVDVAVRRNMPLQYPLDLLDGVKMDLMKNRHETFADLYEFAYRVAGVVGLMMAHVLGFANREALIYAEKLGVAMQLTNILRDVQEDAKMNRIYLPLQEMKEFNVAEDDVIRGRFTDDLRLLMQFQVDRAHRYFEEAQPGVALLEQDSRFAISSAAKIYRGILRRIEDNGYNPFLGRVYVSQQKKMAILFSEVIRTRILQPVAEMIAAFFS